MNEKQITHEIKEIDNMILEGDQLLEKGKLHRAAYSFIGALKTIFDQPQLPEYMHQIEGMKEIAFGLFSISEKSLNKKEFELAIVSSTYALTSLFEEEMDVWELSRVLYDNIWMSAVELEMWDLTVEYLRKAHEHDPDNEYFNFTLGLLLISVERYKEGIEILEEVLGSDGVDIVVGENHVEMVETLVWAYQKIGEMEEIIPCLIINLLYNKRIRIFRILLHFICISDEDTLNEKTDWLYEEMMIGWDESPDIDEILSEFGLFLYKQHKYNKANDIFALALNIDPDNVSAMLGLARLYLDMREFDKVEDAIGKSYDISKKDPEVFAVKAKLHIAKEQYSEALKVAEEGLKIITEVSGEGSINGNILLEEKNDFDDDVIGKNLNLLKKINVKKPERKIHAELCLRKIDAFIKLDNIEQALDELEQAREIFPEEEIFNLYTLITLIFDKQIDKAHGFIEKQGDRGREEDKAEDKELSDLRKQIYSLLDIS